MMEKLSRQRGEITVPIAAAFAGATILVSILSSYYTTQIGFAEKVNKVDTKSEVNAANIISVTGRLDKMDAKLDLLLQRSSASVTVKNQ